MTSMNKVATSIIALSLIIAAGIVFLKDSQNDTGVAEGQAGNNIEIRDGVQYVTIDAKGGYTPRVSNAQAGIPTKVVIKTNGTYDCSSSVVIRSLGYQKVLSQTGEEVIDIGTPLAGTPLQGTCSMGMYSFTVQFS